MANYNRVILIGRFTRDPELKSLPTGGMVCTFGICVNRYRKDPKTGQQIEEAMFIECSCFGREPGKGMAHDVKKYCAKGHLAQIEGSLILEKWNDKATGAPRQRHVVYVHSVQFLTPKAKDESGSKMEASGNPPDASEHYYNIPF